MTAIELTKVVRRLEAEVTKLADRLNKIQSPTASLPQDAKEAFKEGYAKALVDVKKTFEDYHEAFTKYHLFYYSGIIKVLQFIIDNQDELRDKGIIKQIIYKKYDKTLRRK